MIRKLLNNRSVKFKQFGIDRVEQPVDQVQAVRIDRVSPVAQLCDDIDRICFSESRYNAAEQSE